MRSDSVKELAQRVRLMIQSDRLDWSRDQTATLSEQEAYVTKHEALTIRLVAFDTPRERTYKGETKHYSQFFEFIRGHSLLLRMPDFDGCYSTVCARVEAKEAQKREEARIRDDMIENNRAGFVLDILDGKADGDEP